jgi:uncharacterized protein (TIGR02265 family)
MADHKTIGPREIPATSIEGRSFKSNAPRGAPTATVDGRPFIEPPWDAPLDVERALESIPADATISGMFFNRLIGAARAQSAVLPSARERYLAFTFYPLVDLARLVLDAAPLLFPDRPLRQGLRALGRGGPDAFLASTLGKVTLGSTSDVHGAVAAMANGYELNVRPSRVSLADSGPGWVVVHLERVPYFLDSHHVGTFEGALRFAGTKGAVRIASRSPSSADFLLTWEPAPTSR